MSLDSEICRPNVAVYFMICHDFSIAYAHYTDQQKKLRWKLDFSSSVNESQRTREQFNAGGGGIVPVTDMGSCFPSSTLPKRHENINICSKTRVFKHHEGDTKFNFFN